MRAEMRVRGVRMRLLTRARVCARVWVCACMRVCVCARASNELRFYAL